MPQPSSHRRATVRFLALLVGLGTVGPAWAAGFPDVPADHWAYPAITALMGERPLLEPMADGRFHGDQPFTRLQFAHVMTRLIAEIEETSQTLILSAPDGSYHFKDVAGSHPDRSMLLALAGQYHLYDGVPHLDREYFGPDEVVSRYEMAVVIDNLMRQAEAKDAVRIKTTGKPEALPFTDVPAAVWAKPVVESVWGRYKVMVGFPDHTFRGQDELTRYQFAAVAAQTVPLIRALVTQTAQEKHLIPEPTPAPVLQDAPYRADVLVGMVPVSTMGIYLGGRQDFDDWFVGERFRIAPYAAPGGAAGEVGVTGGYRWSLPDGWTLRPSLGVGLWGASKGAMVTAGYGLDARWQFAPRWDLNLGVEGRHGLWLFAGPSGAWLPSAEARLAFWPTDAMAVTFGLAAWSLPIPASGVVPLSFGPQFGVAARF